MNVTIDTRAVVEALKFVERTAGRPISQSINRAGKTFAIGAKGVKGAMQLTPKADKGAIRKLSDDELRGAAIKRLKAKGQDITKASIQSAIKKERARRVRASGYTAFVGWSNAARAFGAKGVKGVTPSTKKEARHGKGSKATPERLVAQLINTAPAIESIGVEATQQALNNTAADLVVYGTRALQKQLDKVSA